MVEAMCEANWPAQLRPTEAKWAIDHTLARGGVGAGRRRVLLVDVDAKCVEIESYSMCVGHGEEGKEGEEGEEGKEGKEGKEGEEEEEEKEKEGAKGGVLSACLRRCFLGRGSHR
jgi:hypothetical protein